MRHPELASTQPPVQARFALILCDVLADEFKALTPSRPHIVHVETLKQGLHNTPPLLRTTLQEAIDAVEKRCPDLDAIVLGYGLCSRGAEGVFARKAKLILPRAHDCITLLLGSKQRYADYIKAHPGTYWYSPGWNRCHIPPGPERYEKLKAEYVAKFGAEDAEFLMESEQAWFKTYDRATYVDVGLTDPAGVQKDLATTQNCATWLNWNFDRQAGSPQLLMDLLDGRWDENQFLVLDPGQSAKMTADEHIVTAVPSTVVATVGLPGGTEIKL